MTDIVYSIVEDKALPQRRILAVLVDNEFGVLNRVVGLFSGRGYNIESLTVAPVDEEKTLSRITVITTGTEQVIGQIKALLDRMVPVHGVYDLTVEGPHVERELVLIKVEGTGKERVEALRIAEIFRAHPVDATTDSFIFELTGTSRKLNAFIDIMRPLGLTNIARSGVVGMFRGGSEVREGHRQVGELRK